MYFTTGKIKINEWTPQITTYKIIRPKASRKFYITDDRSQSPYSGSQKPKEKNNNPIE